MPSTYTAEIDPRLARAIVQNAEFAAQLTANCLHLLVDRMKEEGILLDASELSLPRAFLMEIGAVGQLCSWEMQGLRAFLPANLPTYSDAAAELARRAREEPSLFQTLAGATLSPRVLQVWIDHVSWAAPGTLQANVVLGEADEDVLVEAVAQLLWTHRHDLTGGPAQGEKVSE